MKESHRPTLAEIYHQETKYSEEALQSTTFLIDQNLRPEPFKSYHSERSVSLVPFLPVSHFPLTGETVDPSETLVPDRDSLISALSRILYFTNGVTAIAKHPDGSASLFRAAPSAGALYPTEVYVVCEGVDGLEDGVHNYSVRTHHLVPVFDGALKDELAVSCFGHPAIQHAPAVVVLSGVYRRSSWRYQERAYRRILLDTGHVLGNLQLAAEQEGLRALAIGSFCDETLNRLLFFEPKEEGVLVVAPLIAADVARNDSVRVAPTRRSSETPAPRESDEELFLALHRGSSLDLEELDTVRPPHHAADSASTTTVPLEETLETLGDGLASTIASRRSTRVFRDAPLTVGQLSRILSFGYHDLSGRPKDSDLLAPGQLDTFLIVQSVSGITPGVYRYRPASHDLALVRAGDFAEETYRFCLQQQIGRHAAAFVVHTADLPTEVLRCGNRAYRTMHLDAGVIGERLNLAAMRLGLGASGVGGFYDDEVTTLLGLPNEHAVVYLTVLGVPAEVI